MGIFKSNTKTHLAKEIIKTDKIHAELKALTGLRFIAAMAVAMSHYGIPAYFGVRINNIITHGYSGVTAFFILSGLVLTWSQLHRKKPESIEKGVFYWNRITKIYPLHLFILAILVINLISLHAPQNYLVSHIFLLQAWNWHYLGTFAYNGPAWTLSIEIFAYFCFPFMYMIAYKIFQKYKAKGILLIIGIGSLFPIIAYAIVYSKGYMPASPLADNSAFHFLYTFPISRLGDFIIGIGIGFAIFHIKTIPRTLALSLIFLSLISYLYIASFPVYLNNRIGALYFDLIWIPTFAICLFALGIRTNKPYRNFLCSKWMVTLGNWSFAYYIVHYEFYKYFERQLGLAYKTTTTSYIFFIFIIITVTTVISGALHYVIELPAQKFLRSLINKKKIA